MQIELWWLLSLPCMFVIGWICATYDKKQENNVKKGFFENYEQAIFRLTENKTKQASALILDLAKKNPNSYLLQLSLGILFRNDGRIDKAIEVHSSLLTIGDVSDEYRNLTILELAKDFLQAGLFDRADMSLDLLDQSTLKDEALEIRLSLAQRLKKWESALTFAEEIEKSKCVSLKNLKIHFLCEMACEGSEIAKNRALRIGSDHPRVMRELCNEIDDSPSSKKNASKHLCSACGASFSSHFWKCHVCNAWDTANNNRL